MSLVTPAESWYFGVAHSVFLKLVHRHSVGAPSGTRISEVLEALGVPKHAVSPPLPKLHVDPVLETSSVTF